MLLPNVNSQSTFPHPNQLQCAFSEANNKRKNTLAITPPKLTQFLDNNLLHESNLRFKLLGIHTSFTARESSPISLLLISAFLIKSSSVSKWRCTKKKEKKNRKRITWRVHWGIWSQWQVRNFNFASRFLNSSVFMESNRSSYQFENLSTTIAGQKLHILWKVIHKIK